VWLFSLEKSDKICIEVMIMLIAIILYLIHGLLFGYAARRVSEYRGEADGFWWGFWLGWLGLIVVIFRKPATQEIPASPRGSSVRQSWLCSKCGARNPCGKEQCQSCGASRKTPDPTKACAACGARNKAGNESCFACGQPLKTE